MAQENSMPATGIFSEATLNDNLSKIVINDDEMRKKIVEKLNKLKELMISFSDGKNIPEGIDIKELLNELNSEIENTKVIGKNKLMEAVAQCKEEIKKQVASMLVAIDNNMQLTKEAIKKAKAERKEIKAAEKATTQLALTKYEKDNVFTVFKRLLSERKQSTDKKKPNIFSLFKSAYLEVKLREEDKIDTTPIYDRQCENEEGISKLQGDIKGLKLQQVDLIKEMDRWIGFLNDTIKSKWAEFTTSPVKDVNSKDLVSREKSFEIEK